MRSGEIDRNPTLYNFEFSFCEKFRMKDIVSHYFGLRLIGVLTSVGIHISPLVIGRLLGYGG